MHLGLASGKDSGVQGQAGDRLRNMQKSRWTEMSVGWWGLAGTEMDTEPSLNQRERHRQGNSAHEGEPEVGTDGRAVWADKCPPAFSCLACLAFSSPGHTPPHLPPARPPSCSSSSSSSGNQADSSLAPSPSSPLPPPIIPCNHLTCSK